MISTKTGMHSIAGKNARRTKRVNEHWNGFLKLHFMSAFRLGPLVEPKTEPEAQTITKANI